MKSYFLFVLMISFSIFSFAQGPKSSVAQSAATEANSTATVMDEQGRPVPGATVESYHVQNSSAMMWSEFRKLELKQQTVTDAKGVFTVAAAPPESMLVVVKKPGLAPVWKTWPSEGDDFSKALVLTAPTTLSGVVVDEKNHPVADAEVSVSHATIANTANPRLAAQNDIFGAVGRECFSARTTADGHFRIENFPVDAHAALRVIKPGMAQRAVAGHYLRSDEYRSGQRNIKLLLAPAGAVVGKVVVQETGQPVENVEVSLYPTTGAGAPHGPVKSGALGLFQIPDLQPATYHVQAIMPGKPADFIEATSYQLVTVTAGQTNRDALIRLTSGVLVEVSVVTTNDLKPLASVEVSAGRATGYTDDRGRTLLRVTPGKAGFSAFKPNWSPQHARAEITPGQANHIEIQMIPPRHIAGIVRDANGAPTPGVRVSFHPGFYPGAPFYTETRTDENGQYEMTLREESRLVGWDGPINATNFVLAQDFTRNLAAIEEFGIAETNFFNSKMIFPTNLDLTLHPGITISGSVKDTDGAPITSSLIDLKIMSGRSFASVENKPVRVDGRGSFSYSALPQGYEYDVFDLTARGYGSGGGFVDARNTHTNGYEFPTFVLKRADRILAGIVLDREGKPVAAATLFISGRGQLPRAGIHSDDEGRFGVDSICEGEVKVDAHYYPSPNGFIREEQGDIAAQGGDTNVVIRLGIYGFNAGQYLSHPLQTTGIVRDSSGAPTAGATVSLFPSQGGTVLSQADSDGRYELHWQARQSGMDGTIWLLARDPNRNLSSLRHIDKQTTNLDLSLQPGLTLAAEVRDTDGQAVTNATAMAILWPGGSAGYGVEGKHFAADEQGIIRVQGLPRGYAYNVSIEASGYTSGNRLVALDDTETNFLQLPAVVLTATDTEVVGMVLDAEGKPAVGARVQVFAAGKTVSTSVDSNGRFELHNVSRGTLRFNAGFPIPSSTALSNSGTASGKGGDTNIVVRLGTGREPSAPEPFVTTAGTVLDMTGAPAAGVSVVVLPAVGLNGSWRTDSSGDFSVQWRPTLLRSSGWTNKLGKAVVFARDPEHNLAAAAEADPASTNISLHLLPGLTLSGIVQDTDGNNVTNASAQLTPYPPSDRRSALNRMPPINADAQGRFSINAMPQGAPYAVYVTAPGYGLNSVQVTANETYLSQLQLPAIVLKTANLEVSGQVFDADGKPCRGARLFVEGESQPARSFGSDASSDANGHFVIRRVCEGPLVVRGSLWASLDHPQYLAGTAEARGGDTNVVVNLHIPTVLDR